MRFSVAVPDKFLELFSHLRLTSLWTLVSAQGRAAAQAVSRWLPTAPARVRALVRSCRIFGGQSSISAGFIPVLRFPLPIFIPPTAPQTPSSIIWGWYNRPVMTAVPSGLSLTPLGLIIIIIIVSALSSETSKNVCRTTGCYVPDCSIFYINGCENRKSSVILPTVSNAWCLKSMTSKGTRFTMGRGGCQLNKNYWEYSCIGAQFWQITNS
jgi:hypothetical protein